MTQSLERVAGAVAAVERNLALLHAVEDIDDHLRRSIAEFVEESRDHLFVIRELLAEAGLTVPSQGCAMPKVVKA